VIAYELGYRTQLNSKMYASIATFYNRYDHLRSTSLSPANPVTGLPFPLFFENNLRGQTYGLEVDATYQVLDWWRVRGGYSGIAERIRVKAGRSDFNNALNETADPPHQFSVRSSMNGPRQVEIDAGFRWVDSFSFSNSGVPATVSQYAELDARMAWRPTESMELSVVGQNLLHDHHLEYVISSPNPRQEIKRGIFGKVTMRW
jgi:iron complex outermembrane receptor protein